MVNQEKNAWYPKRKEGRKVKSSRYLNVKKMLEMSDPAILANAHLYILFLIYLAERMKERSTLSIFSSF